MRADPSAQRRLLDLAHIDTELVQLRHAGEHLPENQQLSALQTKRLALSERITEAETRRGDAQAEVDRVEKDLNPAKERLARNEKRVHSGEINSERALKGITDEIEHLKGRVSDLEDIELEAMDRVDAAAREHGEFTAQRTEIENQMRALLTQRDDAKAGLQTCLLYTSLQVALEPGAVARRVESVICPAVVAHSSASRLWSSGWLSLIHI